jgi:CubicO group peptidase (beta-lactamase class C family)
MIDRRVGPPKVPMWLSIALIAISLCIGVTSNSMAQEQTREAEPNPGARAVDSEMLAKLPTRLKEQYAKIRSLLLVHGGCIQFEYYKTGLDAESRSPVHSVTKSVLSILVGVAVDRGYLRLDQKLSELLPEASNPAIDPRIRDITVRNLLTMTSGFDPAVTKIGVPTSEMWQWMLNREMSDMPGTRFNYDSDDVNLLSVVLTRAIRRSSLAFANETLFGPLGITNFNWLADSDGYLIASDNLSLTARDMAKIGLLYLQQGRWGDQQIVSSDYVADSTAKHNDGGPPTHAAYGYLWWVRPTAAGLDAFFAAGHGSQLIYVVPKLDLVVAMASESSLTGGSSGFVNDVVLPVAATLPKSLTCNASLGQGRPL